MNRKRLYHARGFECADDFLNALDAGVKAVLNSNVALSDIYNLHDGQYAVINGNNNTLSIENSLATRVLNIEGVNNVYLALNDVKVSAPDKQRGISAYGSDNVEIGVKGSEVIAENML